jgi:hypothetical protein
VLFEPLLQDYSLSANPAGIIATITSAASARSSGTTITATSINGFNGNQRISISSINPPLPLSGVTHRFNPTSRNVNIPAFGSDTVTYEVTVPATTPKGVYRITFRGTGGSQPTTFVDLNVVVRDDSFKEVLVPILDKITSLIGSDALGFGGK